MEDVYLYVWIGSAILTAVVAGRKDRSVLLWLVLGGIFSLFALLVVACLPSLDERSEAGPSPKTHVKCPDCRELVLKDARVCKHCSCKLVPQS
jgi:hypothetical protein